MTPMLTSLEPELSLVALVVGEGMMMVISVEVAAVNAIVESVLV